MIHGMKVTSVARSIADYELDAGRPDQVEKMIREATERGVLHPPTATLSARRARAMTRLGVPIQPSFTGED